MSARPANPAELDPTAAVQHATQLLEKLLDTDPLEHAEVFEQIDTELQAALKSAENALS